MDIAAEEVRIAPVVWDVVSTTKILYNFFQFVLAEGSSHLVALVAAEEGDGKGSTHLGIRAKEPSNFGQPLQLSDSHRHDEIRQVELVGTPGIDESFERW